MARLRIYTVHINPTLPHPYEEAQFVAEGFSWKAFFFTGLWALYHRLWWHALALFAYNALMLEMFATGAMSHMGVSVLDFGIRLLIGYEAGDWLRGKLKGEGYLTADLTTGDSLLRAEQRFFDRYFAAHPSAS